MATKKAAKKATKKTTAKKAAKKTAAKKAAKKTAAKKATVKKATKKTTARKATKKTSARKATKKTAAKRVAKKPAAKKAAKKATKKSVAKKAITPRKALSNTRKLLEAKQRQARETPAWQQIGSPAVQGHDGYQSPEAADKAQQLHEAESRMEGIQGSISTHDRHAQGRRDSR